jgi:hypothetical protein
VSEEGNVTSDEKIPFDHSLPATEKTFFGRESEANRVIASLEKGGTITTLGFRVLPIAPFMAEGIGFVLGRAAVTVVTAISLLIFTILLVGGTPLLNRIIDLLPDLPG